MGAKEMHDEYADLIARWRASAANPADADNDELKLRRQLSEREAERAQEKKECARNTKPCTWGDIYFVAGDLGAHLGIMDKVFRRELMKEVRELVNEESKRLADRMRAIEVLGKSQRILAKPVAQHKPPKGVMRRVRENALIKPAKPAAKRR
jgi:hypothetical protein